ncbi:diguanylate cyclase (GGDEF)-like protein [Plasticicumulans lactativorans]|uniref:cyclic-guanylate-specific phosphodiesterase n=1 Tax=Plasticicumulans lactativorans TaxID=1133106 RepID=A0A4R2L9H3_9GAMM|nr:EAL domain-containing protein [Plasticicumulans lactativorans]TCO81993.1 diguanylate cyclase (GGDEF)-like protein [Plasticicumulans lactativorans]
MARIAVVDDLDANRKLLVAVLRFLGHESIEAADGAAALELTRREHPDLVICDILMPAMDGYEFVRQLRADAALAHIPVVFYTAYYHEREAQELARACGVVDILTKPCEPEQVIRVVEDALARAPAAAPAALAEPEAFDRTHLRLVTDKLSAQAIELQHASQQLAALIELNLQLASERDKQRLLDQVCRGARVLLEATYASLAVRGANGDAVLYVSHSGLDADVEGALGHCRLDAGLLGRVVGERRTQRLAPGHDVNATAGLPAGYPPVRALVAAPLASLTAVYGWLGLGRPADGPAFTEADEKLLGILAAQAGRIYENGALYAQVQRHAAQLEREIVERQEAERQLELQYVVARQLAQAETLQAAAPHLLRAICTGLGFTVGTLWQVDHKAKLLSVVDVWHAPSPQPAAFAALTRTLQMAPGEGLPGHAWSSGRPVWIADGLLDTEFPRKPAAAAAGFRAAAALPLPLRNQIVGVIDVFATEPRPAAQGLIDTLVAVGDQIGQFFERQAQRENILRLSRVHAVLSGINSAIVRIHDRRELFAEACRIAVEHGQFGIAWVGDVDAATQSVMPLAWAGIDDTLGARPVRSAGPADRIAGGILDAIREGVPSVINDLGAIVAPAGTRVAEAQRRGYRASIAFPLRVEGRVEAILALYAREADFFQGEGLELLIELANDLSFALEFIGKRDRLRYLAYYDALTGLPNRELLLERLSRALQNARQSSERVGVVVGDVDRFRHVNNALGRQAGDELLRELARRFLHAWPEPANVARIVADCFGGFVTGIGDATEIAHLLEKHLVGALGQPTVLGDQELRPTLSAGIAVFPGDGDDADTLIGNAEAALRKAKGAGERYLFYRPEMNARIVETLLLENRLRQALDRDEFVLHYQPKVDAADGHVTGLEALIRWHDPDNGLVSPARFVPLLEETGLMVPVGTWVMLRAIEDARGWRAAGIQPPRIAVNVSPIQLQQEDFAGTVLQALAAGNGDRPGLDLEITESMIMTDVEANIAKLTLLRSRDLKMAIDDFGTGYSSLAYLARLPVNALKIDRSFIDTMTTRPESMTIVSTIVSLAHSLGLEVIAEGVETEEQAKFLRLLKCDQLQGYLISRPLPPGEIPAFLRR